MATRVTINGSQVFRLSEYTHEAGATFFDKLLNTPDIEARLTRGNLDKVREVSLQIDNEGGWIDLATENLWGAEVTIEQAGVTEVWAGTVTSYIQNGSQVLAVTVTEDPQAVFSLQIPNKALRVGSFTGVDSSFSNSTIPIPFGGTTTDPLRAPGMLADRLSFTYLFAEGEIPWSGRVYKDNVLITEGFTVGLGSAAQAIYPGYVYLQFSADPRDSADRWPNIIMEITGVKFGTAPEEDRRNPMLALLYLLSTARGAACEWGLGIAAAKIDSAAFTQAITDCTTYGFKLDGLMLNRAEARFYRDEILKACRGTLAFTGGKYTPKVDQPGTSAKTFTTANMVLDGFGRGASAKRMNLITAKYRNRLGFSTFDYVGFWSFDDATSIARIGEHELKMVYQLISDPATAWAAVCYERYKAEYTEPLVSFKTPDFAGIQNGSIITITYPLAGLVNAKFRICGFKPGVTGARPLATIQAEGYSDSIFTVPAMGTVPADPLAATTLNGSSVDTLPETISNLVLTAGYARRVDGTIHAWIDGTFTKGRNFLGASILASDDAGVTFQQVGTTLENTFRYAPVNPGTNYKISVIATGTRGAAAAVEKDVLTQGATAPADVTLFTAAQDALDLRKVNFTWNAVNDSDLRFYEIRKGTNWDTAPVVGWQIVGTKFELFETANGTYTYLVKAIDTSGNYSANAASKSVVLVIYPSDVSSFLASQNGERILLSWASLPDLDLLGFEVREGASWNLGQIVLDTVTDITALIDVSFERSYTF